MKYGLIIAVSFSIMLFISTATEAGNDKPIVREEVEIIINGIEESWHLEWKNPPLPVCSPDEEDWNICPCKGFAFGERGDLELVRKRTNQKDERFSLTRLFGKYGEAPGPVADNPQAVLRRWDELADDYKKKGSPAFSSDVKTRPLARIMKFRDYDHDGQASEFLLQIGTLPCGKSMTIVVGVSRENPRLHIFTSVNRPKNPLILTNEQWEALKNATNTINVLQWQCGDHGYDVEEEYQLRAENGNIYAMRRTYDCTKQNKRGAFRKEEAF